MDRFSVSIKGVLAYGGKLLLRRNQRSEYELLGGHLEKEDQTPEQRLIAEFAEESGIRIEVLEHREPWLYEVGSKSILIVPYTCRALCIPEVLTDEDGGTLHWLSAEEAAAAFMPQGYKDTIKGTVPHKSHSQPAGSFFKVIPDYVETDYCADICVLKNSNIILKAPLPHHSSPRDFIRSQLGGQYESAELVSMPIGIDQARDTITLNYRILSEETGSEDTHLGK